MFRTGFLALRAIRPLVISYYNKTARLLPNDFRNYATFKTFQNTSTSYGTTSESLLNNKRILTISNNITPISIRTVTKFSIKKGKRKTSKAVVKRFFRLHWGGWIRPKVGRQKKLWKKSSAQKRRLRQHVFCNATQTTLLDKMVTKFWKRPKYYVEDPYTPYHTREEFVVTRKKPIQRD